MIRPARLVVVAAFVLAGSTGSAGGSQKSDLVVFARVRSFSELVTVRPSGAPKRRIARGGQNTSIGADSWSPSGRKIVFAFSVASGGRGLLLVPSTGGAVQRLTWHERYYDDQAPAWSPSGRWIAFSRTVAPRRAALFLIHPNGSGLHRASPYYVGVTSLSWAPDSRRLLLGVQLTGAVTRRGFVCNRVAILKLGSKPKTVRGGACGDSPSWSPDGTKIAFIYNSPTGIPRNTLVIENSDGSGRRVLVRQNAGVPAWSPDGRRIAFSWFTRGASTVSTIGADGRRVRVLTHDPQYADGPRSWSPDGRWILFERQDAIEDFDADVLLIHPDGTDEHAIARDVRYSTATWRPR